MELKTVRWGIVSAGKICHDFVNAIHSYGDHKPNQGMIIAAVAARDKQRALEFAKLHGIAKIFTSYEEMAKSSDIDVAYIGALNPYHYDLSKLFLENGKHVLCEKPLCMGVEQVQDLVELARRKKLFLMEGIWSRFSKAYTGMREQIYKGAIGDIKFLEVNLGINTDSDRIHKKEYGGSAALDIGVYVLQLSQFIFRESARKISASVSLNKDGVDYAASIILQYGGDKRAVMNIHTQLQLCNKATIYGTKGRITLEPPFHFPNIMILPDGTKLEDNLHSSKIPYNFENSAGLIFEALHVTDCIRKGQTESDIIPHEDSIVLADFEDIIRGIRKESAIDKNLKVCVVTTKDA